jgi:alkyl hydroperoxide reductase subunit F
MTYDVIIIGAGPAGMSAAIYTARKKLHTLILSKNIGGQAAASWEVDNYLGYRLVSGQDLAIKFKEHLDNFSNAEMKVGEEVIDIKKNDSTFVVKTKSGEFQSRSIIVASGKESRKINVAGEDKFLGKGLTYCATCDGPLFAKKTVAVIGGGNSALESAIQMSKICPKVYLLVDLDKFSTTADQVLVDKVKSNKKIEILFNVKTKEFIGDKFLSGIKIEQDKKEKILEVSGVFIEIGSVPSVDFLKKNGLDFKFNEWNELEIDKRNMVNIEGIFAAGDVTEVLEKQVIVAAGEGAKAAMQVSEWINRR